MLTGVDSGVIVLDVDPRNGGNDSLAALVSLHGELPTTPRVLTGGGGQHFYFRSPGVVLKSWKPAEGLDLQADGARCIVLPPSRHASGKRYEWAEDCDPSVLALHVCPAWLLKPERDRSRRAGNTPPLSRTLHPDFSPSATLFEAALRGECSAVSLAIPGRRNPELNRAAFKLGQLVAQGLDRGRAETELMEAARQCGLLNEDGDIATRATLHSGLEAGINSLRRRDLGPGLRSPDSRTNRREPSILQSPARLLFEVRGQDLSLADAAVDALLQRQDLGIYVRGRQLVRVLSGGNVGGGLNARPRGAPLVEQCTVDSLRGDLARLGRWVRRRHGSDSTVLPPEWLVREIRGRRDWPFPVLEGVVDAPILRSDGSIHDTPGYDPQTRLLYVPNGDFPPVPLNPGPGDIELARATLLEPFRDFPFRTEQDRATAVAAIFSTVGRYAIEGCVPLFGVRATTPGTGKSLLVDVIALVATGRRASRMSYDSDEGEMRKRVLALGLDGERVVLLDNVDGRLSSSTLAAALTSMSWKDRLLGVSATAEVQLRAVWFVTGNNLTFGKDLGRRVLPIDLDARLEFPEDRVATAFAHPDLCAHVQAQRGRVVIAALTLLRGFTLAGRPIHDCGARMGSFEQWDDLVRSTCLWAGLGDPCATRGRVRADDDSDRSALAAALAACNDVFGAQSFTASEAVRAASENLSLMDALLELTGGERLTGRSLGTALRTCRGRIVKGMSFGVHGLRQNSTCWRVEAGR